MVKRLFRGGRSGHENRCPWLDAARGRAAIEESREILVALDREGRVVAASRRAREALPDLAVGRLLPESSLRAVQVPYEVNGSRETLVYLSEPEENAAYDELRSGFTAAVSHELRTPLARLMSLLETATLPGEDPAELVERAKLEVERSASLIDDVLFLSELETGREVVASARRRSGETAEQVVASTPSRPSGRTSRSEVDVADGLEVPAPAADASRRAREPRHERHPLRGPGCTLPDLRGAARR